jgi:hypothetical protein
MVRNMFELATSKWLGDSSILLVIFLRKSLSSSLLVGLGWFEEIEIGPLISCKFRNYPYIFSFCEKTEWMRFGWCCYGGWNCVPFSLFPWCGTELILRRNDLTFILPLTSLFSVSIVTDSFGSHCYEIL